MVLHGCSHPNDFQAWNRFSDVTQPFRPSPILQPNNLFGITLTNHPSFFQPTNQTTNTWSINHQPHQSTNPIIPLTINIHQPSDWQVEGCSFKVFVRLTRYNPTQVRQMPVVGWVAIRMRLAMGRGGLVIYTLKSICYFQDYSYIYMQVCWDSVGFHESYCLRVV